MLLLVKSLKAGQYCCHIFENPSSWLGASVIPVLGPKQEHPRKAFFGEPVTA